MTNFYFHVIYVWQSYIINESFIIILQPNEEMS